MNTSFYNLAVAHQVKYFKEKYGIFFENRLKPSLPDEEAQRLRNFYTPWMGMRTEIEACFPFENNKILYRNVLHPKHMTLNFFVPIKHMKDNAHMLNWLSIVTCRKIKAIERVQLNYFARRWEYLKDRTSFNVFLKAKTMDGKWLGVGVGICYLEEESSYRPQEFFDMHDGYNNSPYKQVSEYIGYQKEHILELRKPHLKRLWRNHMLGYCMIAKKEVDDFVYVHLYPSRNEFQKDAVTLFENMLPANLKQSFESMTLEGHLGTLQPFALMSDESAKAWLHYLYYRYTPGQNYNRHFD